MPDSIWLTLAICPRNVASKCDFTIGSSCCRLMRHRELYKRHFRSLLSMSKHKQKSSEKPDSARARTRERRRERQQQRRERQRLIYAAVVVVSLLSTNRHPRRFQRERWIDTTRFRKARRKITTPFLAIRTRQSGLKSILISPVRPVPNIMPGPWSP